MNGKIIEQPEFLEPIRNELNAYPIVRFKRKSNELHELFSHCKNLGCRFNLEMVMGKKSLTGITGMIVYRYGRSSNRIFEDTKQHRPQAVSLVLLELSFKRFRD